MFSFNTSLRRLFRSGVFLFVFLVIILNIVPLTLEKKMHEDDIISNFEKGLNLQHMFIENWINERAMNIRTISSIPVVKNLDLEKMREVLASFVENNHDFAALVYVDKDGFVQIDTGSDTKPRGNLSDRQYFIDAKAGKEHVSDVLTGRNRGDSIIIFSAPVYDTNEQFQGLIFGPVFLATVNELMSQFEIGETGETYLTDRNGYLITSPRNSVGLAEKPKIDHQLLNNANNHQSTGSYYTDYRGEKVVGTYKWTNQGKWLLIGEIDKSEVLKPLYFSAMVMIAFSLFILFITYFYVSKVYEKIYQSIEYVLDGAQLITKGNYSTQINKSSIEESPKELQYLCDAFNEMAATVKGNIIELEHSEQKLKADIQMREEAERQLIEVTNRFKSIYDHSGIGIAIVNLEGKIVQCNNALASLLLYDESELTELSVSVLTYPEDIESDVKMFQKIINHQLETYQVEKRYFRKDGEIIWVQLTVSAVKNTVNELDYIISLVEDISAKKKAEEALVESKEYLSKIVETIPNGVLILDKYGKITFANHMAQKILHLSLKDIRERYYNDKKWEHSMLDGTPFPRENLPFLQVMKTKAAVQQVEYGLRAGNGERIFVSINATPLFDKYYNVTSVIASISDITERKKSETQLKQANKLLNELSRKDGLTGIANRRHFNEALEKEWEYHLSKQKAMSLIMFDIDYFKAYNDTYGHQAGDDCLRNLSRRIQQLITKHNYLLARYGGEEFIIILPNTTIDQATAIAELVRKEVEAIQIPHQTSKVSNIITVSVGVTEITPDEDLSYQEFIEKADKALYQAKGAGRNNVKTFV